MHKYNALSNTGVCNALSNAGVCYKTKTYVSKQGQLIAGTRKHVYCVTDHITHVIHIRLLMYPNY